MGALRFERRSSGLEPPILARLNYAPSIIKFLNTDLKVFRESEFLRWLQKVNLKWVAII